MKRDAQGGRDREWQLPLALRGAKDGCGLGRLSLPSLSWSDRSPCGRVRGQIACVSLRLLSVRQRGEWGGEEEGEGRRGGKSQAHSSESVLGRCVAGSAERRTGCDRERDTSRSTALVIVAENSRV